MQQQGSQVTWQQHKDVWVVQIPQVVLRWVPSAALLQTPRNLFTDTPRCWLSSAVGEIMYGLLQNCAVPGQSP